MKSSNILIANVKKLQAVKGYNNAEVCNRAKNGGHSIHQTTLKNILSGKSFGPDKLDAIACAFELEPCYILWDKGIDDEGQPIGVGSSVSLSTVNWAVKKVALALNFNRIDDLDFEAEAISKLIKVASSKGKNEAELEWTKLLTEYSPS